MSCISWHQKKEMLTPLLMFRLHPRPEVLLTRIGLYYPELTLAYAHPSLACATPLQGAPFIIHKVLSAVHIILEYRNILLPVAYGRRRPSPLSLNSLNRSMGWFQRISENISQKTLFFPIYGGFLVEHLHTSTQ